MAKGDDIAALLGGGGGGPPLPPDMGGEMGAEDPADAAFNDAAEQAMAALEAGDPAGFAENLKDAIEICFEKKAGGGYEDAGGVMPEEAY
tara:strand:- start:176 stop:445 length:270 start_codon:yes stop_codon:yes gene_type:complete